MKKAVIMTLAAALLMVGLSGCMGFRNNNPFAAPIYPDGFYQIG